MFPIEDENSRIVGDFLVGANLSGLRREVPLKSGMIPADAAEAGPVPTPLTAVIVNVYKLPMRNPVTVSVVAGDEKVIGDWAIPRRYGVTM